MNARATIQQVRDLKRHAADRLMPAMRATPDFLVIGAQKAGTTSLHNYLKAHPQLIANRDAKELHYFNLYFDRGPGWYLARFPHRWQAAGRLCFEATPDYLSHSEAPRRIAELLGDVKLVAVLREPAARAYSAWKMWHSFADRPDKQAKADPRSFAEAIGEELAAPDDPRHRRYRYVAMGHYERHLANYHEVFDPARILVLDYALMGRDLSAFLDAVCDFVGVDRYTRQEAERLAGTKYWVGPSWQASPEDEATLAALRDHFRPHNEALYARLGRRFDW